MSRAVLGSLLALAALLSTACGAVEGSVAAPATAGTAPELASVTPLADPRDHDGAVHADVAHPEVDPVAPSPRSRLPVTVRDAQGTSVTVTDTSRILALDVYGTFARTVFELGLGDRVVGRDVSTQFAEADDLPLVTSQGHEIDAERILALDPSVVLVDTSVGPWDAVLQVRDAGIPVVVLPSERDLDNVGTLVRDVARALGVPAAGRKLAERLDASVRAVRGEIEAVAPAKANDRLRTVFLYVRGNSGVYYMFGEGSGADSLIDALGLYDVAAEIGWNGMKPVTDEGLIAAQPDLVLMMTNGLESVDGVDGLLEKMPALAQTPAGQHRRIVDMADSQILGFGPLTPQVLNALAVAVYAPGALS